MAYATLLVGQKKFQYKKKKDDKAMQTPLKKKKKSRDSGNWLNWV